MNLKTKKKVLSIVSILNAIIACWTLGSDIVYFDNIFYILFDVLILFLAILPFIIIRFKPKMKHLYSLIIVFALSSVFSMGISNFFLSSIGMVISFIESQEEKGIIEKLLKKHPIAFSITIIISGMAFLSCSSFFGYLADLTYGFDMLGEICATVFLFFMVVACKKSDLIFKNRGSIRESLIVSLPFIIYIFYIASFLLASYMVEGYDFVSFDNIFAVSVFYIFVGIFEDFLIRGLSLNILLDKYGKNERGIWLSVFLSSLFFGVIHFSNLLTGASFRGVLIQVITATCIGFYFSAIYLRSGNVWTPAILHGVYDLAVSVSAFFAINEVVDTTAEYAASISNYSWANLGIGLFYILLTAFLLRKKKMSNVKAMLSGQKKEKTKKDGALKFLLIGFGLGFCVIICCIAFMSMFEIDRLAKASYNKILTKTDYQDEYELTYVNGYIDYDSLSDEVKILLAISNLDRDDFDDSYTIADAERDVSDSPIFTSIDKDKIDLALTDIFGNKSSVNYVGVNISYKTTCNYDGETSKYLCVTTNNSQDNSLKVYSNISMVKIGDGENIEVFVYYLVEDTKSSTLYADSNLKTVYKYDSSIREIASGIEYDEEDNRNRDFWKTIEENNDGLVPTYKLTFKLNDMGDKMYFVSSEFLTDSIKNNDSIKEEVIADEIYLYNSSKYSFNYNKAYFTIEEENNKLIVRCDDRICLEMEVISSDKWLNTYKNNAFSSITLGNYNYYNYGNEYLIYADDFYALTINTTREVEKKELLKLISSIEFK